MEKLQHLTSPNNIFFLILGSYGQAGMDSFRNEISSMNICIALYEKIREYANLEDYELVIKKMNKTVKARVIVCFCHGETIRGLLAAINKLGMKGRFIILGRYRKFPFE